MPPRGAGSPSRNHFRHVHVSCVCGACVQMNRGVPSCAVQPLSVVPLGMSVVSKLAFPTVNGCSTSGFGKTASTAPPVGAAVARTRPSSWRTAPRWASAMPTVSRRTPGFTVWTRSQPFPVVATMLSVPPAVFVQVRPEAASPAALGAGEPMWLVKA